MAFQMISTLMIGVLGASLAYIAFRMSGRRLSKAVIPFAAAAAMLAYSIWNEMTWFARTAATLPEGYAVIEPGPPVSSPLSPWTYAIPRTDSFRVLDRHSVQPLPKSAGRYLAQVHEVARYLPTRKTNWIVDCTASQQAEIGPATRFDDAGLPAGITWIKIEGASRMAELACPAASPPQGK